MIAGHMGKLLAADDVAYGIDSLVAGSQPAVSHNAGFAKFYPGRWQVQPVNDWPPSGSNQNMTCLYDRAVGKCQGDAIWLVLANAGNANAFDECDAVCLKLGFEHSNKFAVIARHNRYSLDDRHINTQPDMRLCHFNANRPAADNHQMIWFRWIAKIVSLV